MKRNGRVLDDKELGSKNTLGWLVLPKLERHVTYSSCSSRYIISTCSPQNRLHVRSNLISAENSFHRPRASASYLSKQLATNQQIGVLQTKANFRWEYGVANACLIFSACPITTCCLREKLRVPLYISRLDNQRRSNVRPYAHDRGNVLAPCAFSVIVKLRWDVSLVLCFRFFTSQTRHPSYWYRYLPRNACDSW